jgi:hypothetical protein
MQKHNDKLKPIEEVPSHDLARKGDGLEGDNTPSGPDTTRTPVRAKRDIEKRKERYPQNTPPSTSPRA